MSEDIESPYCPKCGSCGHDGCCPAEACLYPEIKSETLKEIKADVSNLQSKLEACKKENEILKGSRNYNRMKSAQSRFKLFQQGKEHEKECDSYEELVTTKEQRIQELENEVARLKERYESKYQGRP